MNSTNTTVHVPEHIFKAYDIRGLYPQELNEELTYKIGAAYAHFLKEELSKKDITVAVGEDMRPSSSALKAALIDGITSQGVNVVDIGLASTPTFYFGVAYYGYDGGVSVTASHNPAEYNGLKLVRAQALSVSGDTGITAIRDMVKAGIPSRIEAKRGQIVKKEGVLSEQIREALLHADVKKIKPFTVVVDAANGMGALLMSELFKHLPCKLIPLYFELDGRFPNHEADPLKDENNKALQDAVVKHKADLGIALDGDADRLFFIDDKGVTVEPAIVRGILSRLYLREYPGATICYDIRPGKITVDMIEEAGGKPVVTKVGHSLIKEKAREVGAVFAGESSGHFFGKMPYGFFEAPEIMILKVLEELSVTGKKLSEYVAPLHRYFHSGEINFSVPDKSAVFARLLEKYHDHLQYDFDGLSFAWDEVWFNVRPSNTENKVRLNVEGVAKKVVDERVREVTKVIMEK